MLFDVYGVVYDRNGNELNEFDTRDAPTVFKSERRAKQFVANVIWGLYGVPGGVVHYAIQDTEGLDDELGFEWDGESHAEVD